MYKVQPQNPYTGHNQQSGGGQGLAPTPQFATSPIPVPQLSTPMPQPSQASTAIAKPMEYWLKEVEEVLGANSQSPYKRAAAIAEIKSRYHQEALGVKLGAKAE